MMKKDEKKEYCKELHNQRLLLTSLSELVIQLNESRILQTNAGLFSGFFSPRVEFSC